MTTTDATISPDVRMLIAQAFGTDDLHVTNEFVEGDRISGEIHDHDALTRARFAMMRPDEREVFYLFAEGTSVREISAILGIDEITAEYYRATVYRKMDVATILDLTVLATILGLAQTAASETRVDTYNAQAA